VLSEFFLGGRPGRARVGVRGLLGIRVLCLGKGGSEGVLAFEVILGIVRAVSVIAISILISDREWVEYNTWDVGHCTSCQIKGGWLHLLLILSDLRQVTNEGSMAIYVEELYLTSAWRTFIGIEFTRAVGMNDIGYQRWWDGSLPKFASLPRNPAS
jgi:hypothetical protein